MGRPKKKHAGWRPTVMTEETIQKLESIFKIDWTVNEACWYAGISTSIYYDHLKKNIKFSDKMSQAQQYPFILARKWLFKNVQKEDMRAIESFLKRRDVRYKDKAEVEMDGNMDFKSYSMEELLSLIKK